MLLKIFYRFREMSGATLSGGGVTGSSSGGVLTGGVELCETGGRALKLQADTPHLVSLGGGRLSTAVTLHPIPQGKICTTLFNIA